MHTLQLLPAGWAALLCTLFGLLFGSFSNVLRWRLPRRESIAYPGSHCPACKHPLTALDLVPVLSWLALRGRCRHCRTPISVQYPLWEALFGLAAGLAAYWGGVLTGAAAIALCTAAVTAWGLASRRTHDQERGESLVEVLVAVALLALGLTPVVQVFHTSRSADRLAWCQTQMAAAGQAKLEQLAAARRAPDSGSSSPDRHRQYKVDWNVTQVPATADLYKVDVTVSYSGSPATCNMGSDAGPPPVYLSTLIRSD